MDHQIPYFDLFGVPYHSSSQIGTVVQPRNLCLIIAFFPESCAGLKDKQTENPSFPLGIFSSSYIVTLIQNTSFFQIQLCFLFQALVLVIAFQVKEPFQKQDFSCTSVLPQQQSELILISSISWMGEPKCPGLGHLSLTLK